MASVVGLTNGASHQQPVVDPAVGQLVQQLSKLRADIIAGKHSRFRVPEHLAASVLSAQSDSPMSNVDKPLPTNANVSTIPFASIHKDAPTQEANVAPTFPDVPEPNEVLHQRRQELERILEEQILQKRQLSKQKPCDQEIVADFDVTETLRLAQERVKPWKPSDSASANRSGSSSDSFDENTFYSSQMNDSTTTEEVEPPRHPKRPLRACRFFRQGKECPYGEKCTFSHDPEVVKQVEAEEQQRAAAKQNRANDHGNRRAASLSRKPAPKIAAPEAPPPPPDPQAARIAELEAQLKQMKEQQQKSQKPKIVPEAVERPDSEPPQQPDDARPRLRRDQIRDEVQPVRITPFPLAYQHRQEVDVSLHSLQPPVPIVRNLITTPHAPQPSRVSPLTGAKPAQVVRLQQTYHDETAQSNGSSTDHGSGRASPAVVPQAKSSRKRKRAQLAEDNARKVATRTQNVQSPGIYIKQEPVSPSPLNGMSRLQQVQVSQPEVRLVPSTKEQPRVLPPIPQHDEDGRYVFQPLIDQEQAYTPQRRVVSQQVPQYIERDDQDLRRVASSKHLRQQATPSAFDAAYSDPQPRLIRAASTSHHMNEPPLPPPPYHRASVQPAIRDTCSQPRQVELTPDRPQIITMAPPPRRRIVVDEYGRQYEEVPAPPPEPQVRYQSIAADGQIYRRAEPTRYEEQGRYVPSAESPQSPQYVGYAQPRRKTSMVRLDHDEYEAEPYPPPSRVMRYGAQSPPDQQYEEVAQYQHEERPRPQQIRRAPTDHYEQAPPPPQTRQAISRMGSVRPQPTPRLVRLGENEDEQSRSTRQVSVRPEEGYAVQPVYQYAQHPGQIVGYEENGEQMNVYDQTRGAGRRIVRI